MPPTARDGDEKIVLTLVIHDDWIGAGTIRNIPGFLFKIVLVINVDGVAVSFLAKKLSPTRKNSQGRGSQDQKQSGRHLSFIYRTGSCCQAAQEPWRAATEGGRVADNFVAKAVHGIPIHERSYFCLELKWRTACRSIVSCGLAR